MWVKLTASNWLLERLPCFALYFDEVAPGFSGGQVLFIHSPTGLAIIQGPSAAFSTLLLQETATRWQRFFLPKSVCLSFFFSFFRFKLIFILYGSRADLQWPVLGLPVQQRDSVIHRGLSSLFLVGFPEGDYSVLSRAPWAIHKVLLDDLRSIILFICQSQPPNVSLTPPLLYGHRKFLVYLPESVYVLSVRSFVWIDRFHL